MIPYPGTTPQDQGEGTAESSGPGEIGAAAEAASGAAAEAVLRVPGLTSVDKALRLLLLLRERGLVSVSQASEELEVARSTAHRLLSALQTHGFAHQDPITKAYGPGRVLIQIGLEAVGRLDVRTVAHTHLVALVQELNETVHLITLDGSRTLVLDSVECTQDVRVGSRVGGSQPPNCNSAGKALLAQLAPEEVVALLGPDPLPMLTPRSIDSHAALAEELARVRERGYATNFGENDLAASNIAVAIPGDRGGRRAAITVSAPSVRMTERQVPRAVRAATAAAQRIAAQLDGRA
jgi:IclR family acetate operon transcriptional repressor